MVKPNDALLNNILNGRQFITADLITVTLQNGTTLHYCSGPKDIVFNGNTYTSGGIPDSTAFGGPFWDRKDAKAKVVWQIGSGNDSLTIDVIPGAATVGGMSFLNAVKNGLFDNADFLLQRAFMTTYGVIPSTFCAVTMFQGLIGVINADRAVATFQIDDYRVLFNQQMPKWLFAANCQNTLYDANCTVNAAANASSGTVASGSSLSFLNVSTTNSTGITGNASGWFDNGKVVFNTGQNAGLSIAVSSWSTSLGQITFTSLVPFPFSTTDTFTAYPGCDRSTGTGGCSKNWLSTGSTVFSNIANFRGMPYIPDPATVL